MTADGHKCCWVGTRRVALPYVSSCPPLKTVRTTFTVYGLAPAVSLRVRTKRSFPFRQLHSAFPVDSLRVRWGPLVQAFRRLGGLRHESSSSCGQLSCPQTPTPHPSLPEASGFRWALASLLSTSLYSPHRAPVFTVE